MATLADYCLSGTEFHELLDSAAEKAKPGWEGEFVEELAERFERYGLEMFLSAKQWNTLRSIAGEGGD